jgi:hypothetical protein
VEYTGLQKLRQLGPQLPKHAALILNRSTTDDLERLAAATLYQGRAKIWVVAEMFRLYLPSWQVKRVQNEIAKEREAINARLNEISAQVLVGRFSGYEAPQLTVIQPAGTGHVVNRAGLQAQMAEAKAIAAGVSQKAVSLPVREYAEPPATEGERVTEITSGPLVNLPDSDGLKEQEPATEYDPLAEVISALNAKYPGNYKKEEVLAACLLISEGAFREKKLDVNSVSPTMKEWLVKLGVCYSDNGLPTFAFKKLVIRIAGLQSRYQLEDIVKLTCPRCFTYPITPSHVCPSKGGGRHE